MSRIEAEQIFVYGGVVDLRKGPDSLRALVGEPEPQAWYVFSNRTRELLKFLSVDESGVWCGTRRLHHRRFAWPESPLELCPSSSAKVAGGFGDWWD